MEKVESLFLKLSGKSVFNKIVLQNHIATNLASYAEQCGLRNFVEALDMNCGAIPNENYESAIDPDAPDQFLSFYSHIVDNRLNFVITNMLKASSDFYAPIFDFVQRTAKNMEISGLTSAPQAFQIFQSVILDENLTPENVQILDCSDDVVEWMKIDGGEEERTSENINAASDENYKVTYLCRFCEGLFADTGFAFEAISENHFRIYRKN